MVSAKEKVVVSQAHINGFHIIGCIKILKSCAKLCLPMQYYLYFKPGSYVHHAVLARAKCHQVQFSVARFDLDRDKCCIYHVTPAAAPYILLKCAGLSGFMKFTKKNFVKETCRSTVKILKFGTPQTIAIIVLKIETFNVTLH